MIHVIYGIKLKTHNGTVSNHWCTDGKGKPISGTFEHMQEEVINWRSQNPNCVYAVEVLIDNPNVEVNIIPTSNGLLQWLTR